MIRLNFNPTEAFESDSFVFDAVASGIVNQLSDDKEKIHYAIRLE